jgi:galactokinase
MSLREHIVREYEQRYATPPDFVVRAPGRVNLIGEHTDYNDGFVLPMAIDRAVWIALRPSEKRRIVVHSLDFGQTASFDLDDFQRETTGWVEYMKGVAWALQEAGMELRGWEGVLAGDVPIGAGLSSSAALELATARAFASVADLPWDVPSMAKLCQKAENHWVGVNCGIMDQMISAGGVAGHALLIDCRSLEVQIVPLPTETAVVVMDTVTRRGLRDSAYNERRAQCEAAANFFSVPALRDVSLEQFESRAGELDDLTRRRALHVIAENERTLQAVEAMRGSDAIALGNLMNASHLSLKDDFEVSSPELNAMVDCAQRHTTCYGARMTGAGFGGFAVALVRAEAAETFANSIAECYHQMSNRTPEIYICAATDGADVIEMKRNT